MSVARQILSPAQLELLAEHGEEREAAAGDVLFAVGDATYPLIAIRSGEASISGPSGDEIVRHGAGSFLGEINLLSGQTVFLTAVATEPMRYVAVDRETLRELMAEHGDLSDVLMAAFMARREALQAVPGIGVEIVGPRSSAATRELVGQLRTARTVFHWRDTEGGADGSDLIAGLADDELPLVRLPGDGELRNPGYGPLQRALGIARQLEALEEVDLVVVGGGPAGLGAAVYGASEGLETLVLEHAALGGQAGTSRRIENYLGFPAGLSGGELTARAITQARKFGARMASTYDVTALEPGSERHRLHLDDGTLVDARAVVLATGASYRRLPVDGLADYEGISVFYAAGPLEARRCAGSAVGVVGGGNSAAQAAIWLARGGADVTLLHRRGDLAETMSAYLISDLDRHGVAVRDRSEIAALEGDAGDLTAVTLLDGSRLELSTLFLFLGAEPCTVWLPDAIRTDDRGFVLTGSDAGASCSLETSVPGIFAAGDVRSGSTKRVATAVGDGALVVRYAHEHLQRVSA